MENVLTSENQKADSIWNDTLSLNHGEPLWRDPIKPCVHIFSIWVNEALPNSYFINNFRALVALRTHYILYGSWVMTEIAIAWHLVRHWFFLEPIRSSFATREVYSNDTYYVHSPKGSGIVRCPYIFIHDAVLTPRQIVQTRMTFWTTELSTSSLFIEAWGKSSVHGDQTNNVSKRSGLDAEWGTTSMLEPILGNLMLLCFLWWVR